MHALVALGDFGFVKDLLADDERARIFEVCDKSNVTPLHAFL